MTDQQPRTEITTDQPLFLAPMGRPGDPVNQDRDRLGYVTKPQLAMRHEPECVGPAIVNGYAELADFQHTLRHQAAVEAAREARPLLKAEDRLKDAQRRAKQAHRNLSGEFHILERMLARAARGGRKPPAAALRRLENIEADLDGLPLVA